MRFFSTSLLLILATGCAAGGPFQICPFEHQLSDQAVCLAEAAQRCGPIPRELQKVSLPTVFLQPGDSVFIENTDPDSDIRLPIDQTVMADGTIDLGKFGRVRIAGMSIEQAEAAVQDAIRNTNGGEDFKAISVRLMSPESTLFYVLGEVNSPGSFPLTGRETVLDAILAAGGLSDRASACEIILSRPNASGCRVVLPVCYKQIVQLGDTTTNYQMMPGDRLFVATRSMWEPLMFWKTACRSGCDLCPDTRACPCPDPAPALNAQSPFVMSGPAESSAPVFDQLITPPDATDRTNSTKPESSDKPQAPDDDVRTLEPATSALDFDSPFQG